MHILEKPSPLKPLVFAGYEPKGYPLFFTWCQATQVVLFASEDDARLERDQLFDNWQIDGLAIRAI